MSSVSQHLLEFGPFCLDRREHVLLRNGHPVPLTPKAFETLLALVENHGHVMEKDELLKRVWPDTFVEEATLAKNVSTIRHALGDLGESSQFIETVPKHGYRFIAPVRGVAVEFPPPAGSHEAGTPFPSRQSRAWLLGVATSGAALILAWWGWRTWTTTPENVPAKRIAIVVLPFSNLTADAGDDYLSDGLTEDMISRLGRLAPERLAVIARTTSMQFKQTTKNAAEIGRELNVDYVVEGSVRREGNRVRVNAQLIQTSDQTHVWAENYDREVGQILPLQSELTETIARQVRVVLAPHSSTPALAQGTTDWQAHLLYLKGRYYWNLRRPDALKEAVNFYRQALDRDPNYAPAWAGLATAYAVFDEYNVMPARDACPRAKAAAARALELDPSQVEARAALALVRAQYDWDRVGADQDFKQAVAMNPNFAVARHWYGMSLMAWGRSPEARRQFEQALVNDPLSISIPVAIGASYYHARQFDQAIEHYVRAVSLRPDSAGLRFHLGRAYLQKKMFAEAIREFETGSKVAGGLEGNESLALGYAAAGRRDDALRILKQLNPNSDSYSPYHSAAVYAALGNADEAMADLERAFRQRRGRLTFLNVEPMFDPLRRDPRFQDLCQRIGLPPAAQASN